MTAHGPTGSKPTASTVNVLSGSTDENGVRLIVSFGPRYIMRIKMGTRYVIRVNMPQNIKKNNNFKIDVEVIDTKDGSRLSDAVLTATLNDSDESAVSGFDGLSIPYDATIGRFFLDVDESVFDGLETATQYNVVVDCTNYNAQRGRPVFIIDEGVIP